MAREEQVREVPEREERTEDEKERKYNEDKLIRIKEKFISQMQHNRLRRIKEKFIRINALR